MQACSLIKHSSHAAKPSHCHTQRLTRHQSCHGSVKVPRMVSRSGLSLPVSIAAHTPERISVQKVKPIRINGLTEPLKPTTKVHAPRVRIMVPAQDLPRGKPGDDFWGAGGLKFPQKTEAMDDYDTNRELRVKSFLPGDPPLTHLRKGPYDTRPLKYLWTLDQNGMNFVREMTPFASSRGIVLHSKISPMAVVGGEIWFSPEEDAVYVNFCSGRYPLEDQAAVDVVGKLLLYQAKKVYVVLSPERYGEVTPVLYERQDELPDFSSPWNAAQSQPL